MLGRSAWPISDKSGLVYGFIIEWKHAALLSAALGRQFFPPRAQSSVTAFQRVRVSCNVWSVRSHFFARLFARLRRRAHYACYFGNANVF